jgi:hypothetical protein
MDPHLNRARLVRNAQNLLQNGYNASVIRASFGPGGAWYTQDWRGKKGETPTLRNITEQIAIFSRQSSPHPSGMDLDQKRDLVRKEIQAARKKRGAPNNPSSNSGGAE